MLKALNPSAFASPRSLYRHIVHPRQSQHPKVAAHCTSIHTQGSLDAIMVLGGGYNMDGTLPPWVLRRLDIAVDLFRKHPAKGAAIVCLGGGTPHKPTILDSNGYALHEATMCASYLMGRGVPATAIMKEISSYDTVGNAYFSLVIHAIPARWRHIAVVTSDFHMPRTKQLFTDIYELGARDGFADTEWFLLQFHAASDNGLFDASTMNARVTKEAGSVGHWLRRKESIKSLADVHQWLHATHLCYAVNRQDEFGLPTITDPKLLASY